jgi:hypothetical protein
MVGRLEWKLLTLANTLAYYEMAKITALKSFILETPEANPTKLFLE